MRRIFAGRWGPREFATVAVAIAGVGVVLAGPGRRPVGAMVAPALPAGIAVAVGRRDRELSTPADVVTFLRAGLAGCALAAGTARRAAGRRSWGVAGLAIPALALDAVDGAVARATGTDDDAGARLDMKTDAAVMLVMSALAARTVSRCALVIGAARYVFVAGSWVRPAWAGELPPSTRRRVVAGLQGVVLSVALVPVVPRPAARALLGAGGAALTWSFALDVVLLERGTCARIDPVVGAAA